VLGNRGREPGKQRRHKPTLLRSPRAGGRKGRAGQGTRVLPSGEGVPSRGNAHRPKKRESEWRQVFNLEAGNSKKKNDRGCMGTTSSKEKKRTRETSNVRIMKAPIERQKEYNKRTPPRGKAEVLPGPRWRAQSLRKGGRETAAGEARNEVVGKTFEGPEMAGASPCSGKRGSRVWVQRAQRLTL